MTKRRAKIFISHSWVHHRDDFDRLLSLISSNPDVHFSVHSVEERNPIFLEHSGVTRNIKEQIRASDAFVVINTPAISYSKWLQFELQTARNFYKPIVAINPHGHTGRVRTSRYLDNFEVHYSSWNSRSIADTIMFAIE